MKKLILIAMITFIACCRNSTTPLEVENDAPLTGDLKDCKLYYIDRINAYVIRCQKEKCVTEKHKVGKVTKTTTTCEE